MSNVTARANARGLSKAPHPDAEVFVLAEKCEAAAARYKATGEALEIAEEQCRKFAPPRDLLRTKQDHEHGLFVGGGIGEVYGRDEIASIRVLYRRIGREDVSRVVAGRYERCAQILQAWKAWNEDRKAEEARSGYADALRADCKAADQESKIASQLIETPVSTVDGLMAKMRALRSLVLDEDALTDKIRDQLSEHGYPDDMIVGLSLTRDLLGLAEQKEGGAHV